VGETLSHAAPSQVHVEDEDVYKMRELIHEKPRDVIQYLEEEGVVKVQYGGTTCGDVTCYSP
jgi:hypothetical protein